MATIFRIPLIGVTFNSTAHLTVPDRTVIMPAGSSLEFGDGGWGLFPVKWSRYNPTTDEASAQTEPRRFTNDDEAHKLIADLRAAGWFVH